VPRRVHFVESLPTTASGKVQRFALRELPTNTAGVA
jgi:acyl-coenzyme A synthetase/AMP-(fatty) acid ligase